MPGSWRFVKLFLMYEQAGKCQYTSFCFTDVRMYMPGTVCSEGCVNNPKQDQNVIMVFLPTMSIMMG